MNTSRMIVLAVAAVAAGIVVLLARGLLGGGTEPVRAALAPAVATRGVLVASASLEPGTQLTAENVRWQEWPRSAVDSTFITQDAQPDIAKIVAGAVVRAPLVA